MRGEKGICFVKASTQKRNPNWREYCGSKRNNFGEFLSPLSNFWGRRKIYDKGLENERRGRNVWQRSKELYFLAHATDKRTRKFAIRFRKRQRIYRRFETVKRQKHLPDGRRNFSTNFFEAGLIDEMTFSIQPTILGKGIPLFLSPDSKPIWN